MTGRRQRSALHGRHLADGHRGEVKDYDTTVARIAGNILSRMHGDAYQGELVERDDVAVEWAVTMAFAVVENVKTRCRLAVDAAHAADVKVTQGYLDAQHIKAWPK